jgi:glycosyltransferase involved in cell wall biosynthesis
VLGHIDPGPLEVEVVERDSSGYSGRAAPRPPADYWSQWREEVDLADVMVVNSEWSRKLLCEAGVPEEKIRVVPLAYEAAAGKSRAPRNLPSTFSSGRLLRVLFLGQVNLRKGVGQLFEAIEQLSHDPVEFRFTGPLSLAAPNSIRNNEKVAFVSSVPRHQTGKQYEWADLFILPTLSDGFAITQLEAQAAGVPIVASRRCGEVVRHGDNGLLLDEVTPAAIVAAIRRCISEPDLVARLAASSKVDSRFSFRRVGEELRGLFPNGAECMEVRHK